MSSEHSSEVVDLRSDSCQQVWGLVSVDGDRVTIDGNNGPRVITLNHWQSMDRMRDPDPTLWPIAAGLKTHEQMRGELGLAEETCS